MIAPEEARRRLDEVAVADARTTLIGRVGRLGGTAARVLTDLLDPSAAHRDGATPLDHDAIGTWLDAQGSRTRRRVFRTLHPTLGDLLLDTWDATLGDPYQVGYVRRAFRAPGQPELTRAARTAVLQHLVWSTAPYEQSPAWFAAWAPHTSFPAEIGRLLAVAMDAGDEDVRHVLYATVRGEHEVGQVGSHLTTALLSSSHPDDWAQVERLLLAAQRQEGLRSVVLETVDLAHPEAFRRMLRLVRDEGLTRFAAVVRAVGVWFGTTFDVRDRPAVDALLDGAVDLLGDPATRDAALADPDPARVRLALWTAAFEDAPAAVSRAAALLTDEAGDRRLAAAHLLLHTHLEVGFRHLLPHLTDPDRRVAALAHAALRHSRRLTLDDAEAPVRELLDGLDRPVEVDTGILKPEPARLDPAEVADTLVQATPAADVVRVADLLGRMSATGRAWYARLLADDPTGHRQRLLDLLPDRSGHVQNLALAALEDAPAPTPGEATALEDLLRRRTASLRRGVIGLLLRQADDDAVASVHRLREGEVGQRNAAVELLRELLAAGRGGEPARGLAAVVAADRAVPEADRELVAAAAGEAAASSPAGVDVLVDHDRRTPPTSPPRASLDVARPWAAGIERVLTSLDAWLAEHRDVEVTVERWQGPEVVLLSNLRNLAEPDPHLPWSTQVDNLPLADLVEPWWERTVGQLSDGGVEALLAWPAAEVALAAEVPDWASGDPEHDPKRRWPRWLRKQVRRIGADDLVARLQYTPVTVALLRWYAVREARPGWVAPLLDVAEAAVADVPAAATRDLPSLRALLRHRWGDPLPYDWRSGPSVVHLMVAVALEGLRPELFDRDQRARLWRLARFVDEPQGTYDPERDGVEPLGDDLRVFYHPGTSEVPRRPSRRMAPLGLAIRAIEDGAGDRADLVELLVTERFHFDKTLGTALTAWMARDWPLSDLTRRRRPDVFDRHPWVEDLVDDVRDHVLAVEQVRGELPTPVSAVATTLRSVRGAATVVRLLATLGRQSLVRGWASYGSAAGKPEVLSHLIRVAFPDADDTPETFAVAARDASLTDKRLLELAVYAPQWAPAVEHTVGWAGLADAVHWLHAHTKGERWQVDADVRDEWAAVAHERTPLTADELVRGHVDVAWFGRVRAALGDERFDRLLAAARLASSGDGHKRAELFANALRGTLDRDELDRRVTVKRYQDGVRALGLLPLPAGDDTRRAEVLARYEQLQEWRKGSRRFGQQRRASEAVAVEVAMANLARTAGYADPQRLQWSMEAEAIRDLADGPVTVTEDDVTLTLSLTAEGAPELAVRRGDRRLKSVPKAVARREAVVALKDRVARLRDQTRRMRASLETAAVRGETFTPSELAELFAHPTLAPQLRALVLATEEGLLGRPDGDGTTLLGPDGAPQPADGSPLRVAHPVDLLASDRWHEWQRALFDGRIRQPFKQVFRELYLPTATERGGVARSDRYAGHQVNPRQAIGLFSARGWVADREFGMIRTFHVEGVTVRVSVLDAFLTAAEAADTTLESVTFTPVGSWEPMPIEDVPPRLFSEAMRDLDLVVSVAHSGGVDPEATASTVEMRGALVRETADLLSLDNIELTDHHVLVAGRLGSYSVHLGSGTVHRRPGNAVCIVPVGAQHRGRLFLPFVDDDPRTAEVVSKVVLLARDDRIQDPTVLAQLRG